MSIQESEKLQDILQINEKQERLNLIPSRIHTKSIGESLLEVQTHFSFKMNEENKSQTTSQFWNQCLNNRKQQIGKLQLSDITSFQQGNFINSIYNLSKQVKCYVIQEQKLNSSWSDQESINPKDAQLTHQFGEQTFYKNAYENNIINLRGGGCGSSVVEREISKQQKVNAQSKELLPFNFITDFQKYLEIIINKAQLASDERQKQEILIALQWFNVMKEHFNTLCIDSQSAASVYDLIFGSLPQLLKSLVIYLRINGFLCIQVLQIINDLCRVLFTFYMTNNKRFMKIQDKEIFDELILDFETQLDIEQSNIWIAGAEFEITMVKAVIESAPTNSDEGQKLLITFLGGLVKSALTMSPTDDLISSLIDGAKFLYKAHQVQNLKKKYEIYYYFEQLKWNIIQLLRQKVSTNKVIQLLQNTYQKYIENNKEWLINFCWCKFISGLIQYRPIIQKQQLSEIKAEQQKNWNHLIKSKFINQLSFNKNIGRVVLQQDYSKQDLNQILYKIDFRTFYIFNIELLNILEYSERNIFSFKEKNLNEPKKNDYLLGQFQENIELDETIEQLCKQSKGLKQLLRQIAPSFEEQYNGRKDTHHKQANLKIDEIMENIEEFIKECLNTFWFSNNMYKTFQLYFHKFNLILNSILIDNSVNQEVIKFKNEIQLKLKNVENSFSAKCEQTLKTLQQTKQQILTTIITIQVNFGEKKLIEKNDKLMEEKFPILTMFFSCVEEFNKSCEEIIEKLQTIAKEMSKEKALLLTYVEEKTYDFVQTTLQILNENDLKNQIDTMLQELSASKKQEINCSNKLIIYHKLKYLMMDFVNQMNDFEETIKQITTVLQKNDHSPFTFELIEQPNTTNNAQIQVDDIIQHQFECIKQFFEQEEKQDKLEKLNIHISAEKIVQMLRKDEIILERMQLSTKNEKMFQPIRYALAFVKQYLEFYLLNPKQLNSTKEQILKIYEKKLNQKIQNQTDLSLLPKKEMKSQQNNQIIVKQFQYLIQDIQSQKKHCEIIFGVLTDKINLSEKFQTIETELNFTSEDFDSYTQEFEKNYESILEENFSKLNKNLWKIQGGTQSSDQLEKVLQIFYFLRPRQAISNYIERNILKQVQQQITNTIEIAKSVFDDSNYKVRQCFVINLISVQSSFQESHLIKFCQECLLQIWTQEKDERVKNLLKNPEFSQMQKMLFINDLSSFSSRLQSEMEDRLNKMNDLEQKIYLEGDSSIRQQLQEELQIEQQDFEDYLENVNDMASKLDIGIQFLKDIQRSLTQLKQKLDKLQDIVNNIGDDVRKLRGKTFNELLNIRKRKVLEQMQLSSLNQVYISLNCQEYDPDSGNPIQNKENKTTLLHDDYTNQEGEINEFLQRDALGKDVFLLRGVAGSGKSLAARKIEEFLWLLIDKKQSSWIPIYVSLPTLKEPKFNLIDQALESDYYQFDKIQVKEFKEALNEVNTKIILILDSYDEMKQECIQSNLYHTNRFQKDLFGNVQDSKRVKEFLKVIITTRTEILTSNSYQTWFYGDSIKTLKEVELLGFDQEQQTNYLKQYTLLSMKREFLDIYNLIKQIKKEKMNYEEFCKFWQKINDYYDQEQIHQNQIQKDLMVTENQVLQIIQILKNEKIFQISKDQQVNLTKKLMDLWSYQKFQDLIKSAQIQHILTTPFMMELVVQVLPSMIKKYSDASQYKEQYVKNFIQIKQSTIIENQLIRKYENQRLVQFGQPEILQTNYEGQETDFRQQALTIWDQLQNLHFFKKFSLVDKISKVDLNGIKESSIVIRALIIKQLTVFDFYMTFVEFYHSQQIKKQQELGRMINLESFMIDLFNFSQSLAINLTINELSQIKYIQKGQLELKFINSHKDSEEDWLDSYFNDFQQNGEYKKLIRSCILLTQKGGNHSFTHKSIQEFFVGHFLLKFLDDLIVFEENNFDLQTQSFEFDSFLNKAKKVNEKQEQTGFSQLERFGLHIYNSILNQNLFNLSLVNYKGVLSLIREEMKLKSQLKKKLLSIVRLSQVSQLFKRASSNSLYLLSYNNEFLGYQNFQNIKISDIELIGVSFYGSDLRNSQFTNVRLTSCNFSEGNLQNVNWTNIQCEELPALGSKEQQNSIINLIFLKNSDNLLSIYNTYIGLWNVKTGIQTDKLDFYQLLNKEKQADQIIKDFSTVQIILSPDEKFFALLFREDKYFVQLFDYERRQAIGKRIQVEHPEEIICFSHSSTLLACTFYEQIILSTIQQDISFTLSGHNRYITQILFTADDKILISCSEDTKINLWNLQEQNIIQQIFDHESFVNDIALSSDGFTLASCSKLSSIKLWNIQTQKFIADLRDENQEVQHLKFITGKQILVSWGSREGIINIWNTIQGKIIRSISYNIFQIWFKPDDKVLAIQNKNQIEFWDVEVGKKIQEIGGQQEQVNILVFQPNTTKGTEIIATVIKKESVIHLWDYKIQNTQTQLDGHKSQVELIGFSPDGLTLYSYGLDYTVRLWNVEDGKQQKCLENVIYCREIQFSKKGEFLFIQSDIVNLWYFKENSLVTLQEETFKNLLVNKFFISSKGVYFAVLFEGYSYQDKIKIFDIKLQKEIALLEMSSQIIIDVIFSQDDQLLASITIHRLLQLWDLKKFQPIFSLTNVDNLIFSPDSKLFAAEKHQEDHEIYNLEGNLMATVERESIQFSYDSQYLMTSRFTKKKKKNNKNQCCFWNSHNGELIKTLPQISKFTPDGLILSLSDDQCKIELMDMKQESQMRVFEGHSQKIVGMKFSNNKKMLVSFCSNTIIIWDYLKGQKIKVLNDSEINFQDAKFSPNDEILVSSNCQDQVIFWNIQTEEKMALKLQSYVKDFIFSPDSNFVCFSELSHIRVFNLQEFKEFKRIDGHSDCITKLGFSQDSSILISFSYQDQCILLWDTVSWKLINAIQEITNIYNEALLSHDDKIIASNYGNKSEIRLYDSENGQLLAQFKEQNNIVREITFSPDSRFLASCNSDFTLKLWDMNKLQLITQLLNAGLVRSIQFSPNSRYLTYIAYDFIKVLDIQTEDQFFEFRLQTEPKIYQIQSIAFQPNSNGLVFCATKKILFWNFKERQQPIEIEIENKQNDIYGFLGDGTQLLVIGARSFIFDINSFKIIPSPKNVTKGAKTQISQNGLFFGLESTSNIVVQKQNSKIVAVLNEHTQQVNQIVLSPNNQIMASCSGDCSIKLTNIAKLLNYQNESSIANLSSYKTLALYSKTITTNCLIEGAIIQSNMGWDLKELFSPTLQFPKPFPWVSKLI